MLSDVGDPTETIGYLGLEARGTDDLSEDRTLCRRLRRGASLIHSFGGKRFPVCGRGILAVLRQSVVAGPFGMSLRDLADRPSPTSHL